MFEIRQILGPTRPPALGPTASGALASSGRKVLSGLCAAALLVLSGCGQKGPLYLPDGQTSTAPAPVHTNHKTQR